MNKKIIKWTLVLVILIIVLFLVHTIIKIYAIFHSELYGTIEVDNANWKIYINGTDISSGIIRQFTINQINIETNSHVENYMIAPNVTGDFSITIDPIDTDVSVRYDIQIDKTQLTNEQILITSIVEQEHNNTLVLTAEDTYTGVIPLSSIKNGDKNTIKFTVSWINSEANNSQDTQMGRMPNLEINIPITVGVTQYLGEDIIQYVP